MAYAAPHINQPQQNNNPRSQTQKAKNLENATFRPATTLNRYAGASFIVKTGRISTRKPADSSKYAENYFSAHFPPFPTTSAF
jgi:hypothetical protein